MQMRSLFGWCSTSRPKSPDVFINKPWMPWSPLHWCDEFDAPPFRAFRRFSILLFMPSHWHSPNLSITPAVVVVPLVELLNDHSVNVVVRSQVSSDCTLEDVCDSVASRITKVAKQLHYDWRHRVHRLCIRRPDDFTNCAEVPAIWRWHFNQQQIQ